jgi:hypothetical protein
MSSKKQPNANEILISREMIDEALAKRKLSIGGRAVFLKKLYDLKQEATEQETPLKGNATMVE